MEADKMAYVTKTEAAERLEVSKPRITALVASNTLRTKYFDGKELVSLESIEAYRRADRTPGRKCNR